MGDTFVVSGLTGKRAEVAGRIAALEKEMAQMRADLLHIDAVLRLYGEAEPEAIPPKRPVQRNDWFRVGECSRMVLDALRRADAPLTTREMTERLLAAKGQPTDDARTRAMVQRTVLGTLNRMKGMVEKIEGRPGADAVWRLVE